MALDEPQDLHFSWKLDEEFPVPFEMMNVPGIAARERTHGVNTFPIRDRHELGVVFPILAERLNTERLADERLDASLVVLGLILVGAFSWRATAPDTDDSGVLQGRRTHHLLHLSRQLRR
jgi:hypothetical protein